MQLNLENTLIIWEVVRYSVWCNQNTLEADGILPVFCMAYELHKMDGKNQKKTVL